jgi:hypothetical protein
VGVVCRRFDIILDNNLKREGIIFEMIVDYVAEGLRLSLRIMLSGLKHYNLLF